MATGAPNALEGLFSNPGMQCTLFPFLGVIGDSDGPACWDLWFNTLFVHEIDIQGGELDKWDKAPGINPYFFAYLGLAFAISISVLGAAW